MRWTIPLALALLGTTFVEARVTPYAAEETILNFDDVAAGKLPKDWTVAETNGTGKKATWQVEADPKAPSPKNVLRLTKTTNTVDCFNMLLSDKEFAADLEVSVKLRADSGEDDQGGGLVWRAKDAKNYYVARWNPLEKNVRLYKVVAGRRTQLKSADDVKAEATGWHDLKIKATGKTLTVDFDGKKLLEADDEEFAAGGKVAVWTKADAASSFDDLKIVTKK